MLRESLNILCETSVFLISREESFLSIHEHLGGCEKFESEPQAQGVLRQLPEGSERVTWELQPWERDAAANMPPFICCTA